MSAIDDGGPASPVYDFHGNGQMFIAAEGMSMRDYFAAKAMQGFAADPTMDQAPAADIAEIAYVWADAMLKARNQKDES